MIAATLVVGGTSAAREAAIAARLVSGQSCAIILEGLPDGRTSGLDAAAAALEPAPHIHRIAAGCLCCAGNLVLRVTLNRIVRHAPARLFIAPRDPQHLPALRLWLGAAPYDALLSLGADVRLD